MGSLAFALVIKDSFNLKDNKDNKDDDDDDGDKINKLTAREQNGAAGLCPC